MRFLSPFCICFLQNLFQTLFFCIRTHLHIAVVHNTAYNICIISCRVLETIQIRGLVFQSSTMILFTLPYPLFIFCYCLSSMFYIKRIIHRGFHIVWSLQHTICQLYWASEFSSSRNISLCLVPDTLLRQEVPAPVWCHHFISSVCLRIGFLQSLFQLICILRWCMILFITFV